MEPYMNVIWQIVKSVAAWDVKYYVKPLMALLRITLNALTIYNNNFNDYPLQGNVTVDQRFDYIVIGSGSAGSVVASRLTENSNVSSLLIEAGNTPSFASDLPAFFPLTVGTTEDWNLQSVNDDYSSQAVTDGVLHLTSGKMMGGTSGLNHLLYTRGIPADYHKWEKLGNKGWGWNTMLKYFKLSETLADIPLLKSETADFHGTDGPIQTRRTIWERQTDLYLNGFKEAGYKILFDINGPDRVGYGMGQFNTGDHYRENVAKKYLKPARFRNNLSVLQNTVVTKILINHKYTATGVEMMLHTGEYITVRATKEVILCAGVFNSPKLLMLSGIGSKRHLKRHNIDVVVDAPEVGQNLIDAPTTTLLLTGKTTIQNALGQMIDLWTNFNTFPNPFIVGFGALNRSQPCPQYKANVLNLSPSALYLAVFCSAVYNYNDEMCIRFKEEGMLKEALYVQHSLLHPTSRGSVRLSSDDPMDPPLIRTGFYSDDSDLDCHAKYLQDFLNITNTKQFKSFKSRMVNVNLKQCRGKKFGSLEYLKCYILNTAVPTYNFGGTCAMGRRGVVDERLRVKCVKKLRVVDASVIPSPISTSIHATVVAIAERASRMIKADNS